MSAFDRHPLKGQYEHAARSLTLSPQNRRVRFAVDLEQARAKGNTCREPVPRQVRRQVARLGISSYVPAEPVGPDEV